MAYDDKSPEALLGKWGEGVLVNLAISRGWHVVQQSTIGRTATMVLGPNGKLIQLDILLLDLLNGRKPRLLDVKTKRGAYCYKKLNVNCTGIDKRHWEHYQEINEGIPVDIGFIHLHWPLRDSPDIIPTVLWQTISVLQQRHTMSNCDPCFQYGGVVWDVSDFENLGTLAYPPQHIIDVCKEIKCNLRQWETGKLPRLRRPKTIPGEQYRLIFNP